jgi:hypothetical protein
MWGWRRGGEGAQVSGGRFKVAYLTMINPGLPGEPPAFESQHWPEWGVILRCRFNTPEETYLHFKMGPAAGHCDSGDEGSITWHVWGIPLVLDYGMGYWPGNNQAWMHNRISFDHRSDNARGRVTCFQTFPESDYTIGTVTIRSLFDAGETPDADPEDQGEGRVVLPLPEVVPANDWRRALLFVKGPDYLVLGDELRSRLPSDWSLHVLAERVKVDGLRATFTGQFGVDLEVHLAGFIPLGESRARLHYGRWEWEPDYPRYGSAHPALDPIPGGIYGEKQFWIRAYAAPGEPYLSLLFPRRSGESSPRVEALSRGDGHHAPGFRVRYREEAVENWIFLSPQTVYWEGGDPGNEHHVIFHGKAGWARLSGG